MRKCRILSQKKPIIKHGCCIIAQEGIGDFVHSTVLISALQRSLDYEYVDFVGSNLSLVDAVKKWNIFNRVYAIGIDNVNLSAYRTVICGRHCYSGKHSTRSKYLFVPNRNDKGKMQKESVYVTNKRYALSKGLAVAVTDKPFWMLDNESQKRARQLTLNMERPIIGIHNSKSCGFWHRRKWPVEYWTKLVKKYTATWLRFGEYDDWGRDTIENTRKITVPKDLQLLAALINECDLFISSETGLSIIAQALNVPTILLSGPVDFLANINATVIKKKVCNMQPCYLYCGSVNDEKHIKECQGSARTPCMEAITVDMVLNKILEILENGK